MSDLRNRIAAAIRKADGSHTLGASALADAIVDDLGLRMATEIAITDELLDAAVDALIADGWEETHEGPLGIGTLSREDLRNIARVVLRARVTL